MPTQSPTRQSNLPPDRKSETAALLICIAMLVLASLGHWLVLSSFASP